MLPRGGCNRPHVSVYGYVCVVVVVVSVPYYLAGRQWEPYGQCTKTIPTLSSTEPLDQWLAHPTPICEPAATAKGATAAKQNRTPVPFGSPTFHHCLPDTDLDASSPCPTQQSPVVPESGFITASTPRSSRSVPPWVCPADNESWTPHEARAKRFTSTPDPASPHLTSQHQFKDGHCTWPRLTPRTKNATAPSAANLSFASCPATLRPSIPSDEQLAPRPSAAVGPSLPFPSSRQRVNMDGVPTDALMPDGYLDALPLPLPPPRLYERLGQLAGYTWDESKAPRHFSYDFWYVFVLLRSTPGRSMRAWSHYGLRHQPSTWPLCYPLSRHSLTFPALV